MSLKKDKEKVIDPVWGEERIREFLALEPPAGENEDFHRLLKAYQSMRLEDFDTFVSIFKSEGGDLSATSQSGKSIIDEISAHRHGQPYIDCISNA